MEDISPIWTVKIGRFGQPTKEPGSLSAYASGPTSGPDRYLDLQNNARSRLRDLGHLRQPTPLRGNQKQSRFPDSAEHTSEATAIKIDGLQNFTAFADTYAALVWDVGVPHRAYRIQANTIRHAVVKIRPNAPVR